MGFFSKNKEEKIYLLLEISSGSIGACLFSSAKDNPPLILKSLRKNFSYNETLKDDKKSVLDTLNLICQDLQKNTLFKPDKIFCVISSPWSYGNLVSLKYKKEKEFMVKKALIDKLINDEVLNIKNKNSAGALIDRKVVKFSINGYDTENPINKKGTFLNLDVFLSFVDLNFLNDIEDNIHKTYKNRIVFTSQFFSNFICIRDIFESHQSFIGVDFGENSTEVLIVKNDYLIGTAFFPFGKNQIIKNIAIKTNKSIYETRSLINLFYEGYIDDKINDNFIKIVESASLVWLNEFKNILEKLLPEKNIPHNIFLFSDSKTEGWLSNYFSPIFFPEFFTPHNGFNVIINTSKDLHDFVYFAEKVDRDP